jgi:hypothetical protein
MMSMITDMCQVSQETAGHDAAGHVLLLKAFEAASITTVDAFRGLQAYLSGSLQQAIPSCCTCD